jgi:hypothetical protein
VVSALGYWDVWWLFNSLISDGLVFCSEGVHSDLNATGLLEVHQLERDWFSRLELRVESVPVGWVGVRELHLQAVWALQCTNVHNVVIVLVFSIRGGVEVASKEVSSVYRSLHVHAVGVSIGNGKGAIWGGREAHNEIVAIEGSDESIGAFSDSQGLGRGGTNELRGWDFTGGGLEGAVRVDGADAFIPDGVRALVAIVVLPPGVGGATSDAGNAVHSFIPGACVTIGVVSKEWHGSYSQSGLGSHYY